MKIRSTVLKLLDEETDGQSGLMDAEQWCDSPKIAQTDVLLGAESVGFVSPYLEGVKLPL
jgi:hypothetical protein